MLLFAIKGYIGMALKLAVDVEVAWFYCLIMQGVEVIECCYNTNRSSYIVSFIYEVLFNMG